jgi:hypothetical protein
MRDQSPQPSGFVFPVSLQPADYGDRSEAVKAESWGLLEMFVVAQVFWGVLLFVPGSQGFRTYVRAFPYVISLIALLACARTGGTDTSAPVGRWIIGAVALLIVNLVHPESWLTAGIAQVVFQVAIAAPIFWCARVWVTEARMERLLWLIFGANFISAGLGLLQVYYPQTFLPPEFSSLALRLNPEFINQLTYAGAGDRTIVRPPGLSDLPGGAAISGTVAAILGFSFANRPNQRQRLRAFYFASVVVGITVVYLTQVRSMLLMIFGCMLAMALIRLRQGRVVQSGWLAASAGILVFGSFLWAVTVGGDIIQERFWSLIDSGVMTTYQENRGFMLDYTVRELPTRYPFGAGLGRWGMMSVYFDEPGNWQNPPLYAEIQPTGWIFDGGVLMWLAYGGALLVAMRHSYRLAIGSFGILSDFATMIFLVQLMIAGLCLTGPVFNTQVGIMFWLATAMLYGCQRTLALQEWQAEADAEAEADEATRRQADAPA